MVCSLLGQVSHGKRRRRGKRERPLPVSDRMRFLFGVSLTTNNLAYRTGLRDNNCGLRNFQRAVSTRHSHSTENKTGFENQSVSATNVVGGYMKVHVETGRGQPRPQGAFPWLWSALRTRLRQRSLSFPSFFFCRERTQLAGKQVWSQ